MMESAHGHTSPDKLAEIRRLNVEFRTTFRGGQVALTASVAQLPAARW